MTGKALTAFALVVLLLDGFLRPVDWAIRQIRRFRGD